MNGTDSSSILGEVKVGDSLNLSATVQNLSHISSSRPTLTYYYRFGDNNISIENDIPLGSESIPCNFTATSSSFDNQKTVTAPTTAGTYSYYACVGTTTHEVVTDNNCSKPILRSGAVG